jgi:hypothetical protein
MKQALVIVAIATGFNVLGVPMAPDQRRPGATPGTVTSATEARLQPDGQQCWFDPDLICSE